MKNWHYIGTKNPDFHVILLSWNFRKRHRFGGAFLLFILRCVVLLRVPYANFTQGGARHIKNKELVYYNNFLDKDDNSIMDLIFKIY